MDGRSGVERRGYRVVGRVQGVGFRWWTVRVATELGLGGHVRNLADGSVEVHAAGPTSALTALERALREGPTAARVDAVHPLSADPRTPSDEFLMERWQ